MDYDIDNSTLGAFSDVGATVGTASATQSYELDDPNTSNIFSDFAGSALTNTNNVGSAQCDPNFPPEYCDVAWGLGESLNVNPLLYSGATVTFTVSTSAPTSGFYLEQTNGITGDTIFLSDTVSLTPLSGPPPIPEPSSLILFATLIGGAFFLRKRSSANVA
jgi:hypothetical protein